MLVEVEAVLVPVIATRRVPEELPYAAKMSVAPSDGAAYPLGFWTVSLSCPVLFVNVICSRGVTLDPPKIGVYDAPLVVVHVG